MTGSGLSVSMYKSSASSAACFAAGRVDGRPFSAMVAMVICRVLQHSRQQNATTWLSSTCYRVQPCWPEISRKAHNAARPSCCAATFESPTTPFHMLASFTNWRTIGSFSLAASLNSLPAASYASFRTFQFLCVKRSGRGRALKSSSWSAMLSCNGLCAVRGGCGGTRVLPVSQSSLSKVMASASGILTSRAGALARAARSV